MSRNYKHFLAQEAICQWFSVGLPTPSGFCYSEPSSLAAKWYRIRDAGNVRSSWTSESRDPVEPGVQVGR